VIGETEAGIALEDLLTKLGPDAVAALARGGVFVDGRRMSDAGRRLRAGQCVEVHAPRLDSGSVEVLGEHAGLVAVLKPAPLPTEADRAGSLSLISALAQALGVTASSLHPIGRLDVGVSGIVVVARDDSARKRAFDERATGVFNRRYLGIAAGRADQSGVWRAPVDERPAETSWRLQARAAAGASLLALEPITGRMHQIRAHAAAAGLPLYGDRRYGGPSRVVAVDGSVHALGRIALHATRVEIGSWAIEAPLPDELVDLWRRLGGGGMGSAQNAPLTPKP
jgi:23S rRNA-/tRNA-specific pseudouridylate synthase